MNHDQIKVFSFDLFDTILYRYVDRPHHIFYFVGQNTQSLTGLNPVIFMNLRRLAEKVCRLRIKLLNTREDIDLETIYRLLGKGLRLGAVTTSALMENELSTEEEFIYTRQQVIEYIGHLGKMGKRVIFTSDMYLPFSFLYRLLNREQIIKSKDQLYLSSKIGRRKRTGNLFKHLLARENIAPAELFHIGDNFGHDYEVPKALGIRATCYSRQLPNASRRRCMGREEVYRGLIRQASGQTYSKFLESGEKEEIAYLGAYLAGPVLFSYVHWLVHEAIKQGIKTLYFLARDGQILIQIAELVRRQIGSDLELRYLYASRHAWLLPSILDFNKVSSENKFFVLSKELTLRKLLRRFKIENQESDWLTCRVEQTGLELDEKLNVLNLKKAKKLFEDPVVLEKISEIGDRDFKLVSGYLKQEGLFGDDEYGLVDLGWRGTLPLSLRRILNKNRVRTERGFTTFFFDQYDQDLSDGIDACQVFLTETSNEYRRGMRNEMEAVMEVFASATHESTYGFEEVQGSFRPVFISEDLTVQSEWGLSNLQRVVLKFGKSMFENPGYEELPPVFLYRVSLKEFFAFLNNPATRLAKKLAQFPYTVQQIKDHSEKYNILCSPYSFADFAALLRNRNIVKPDDLWIQGSLALTASRLTRVVFAGLYKLLSSRLMRLIEKAIARHLTSAS